MTFELTSATAGSSAQMDIVEDAVTTVNAEASARQIQGHGK